VIAIALSNPMMPTTRSKDATLFFSFLFLSLSLLSRFLSSPLSQNPLKKNFYTPGCAQSPP